jgi:hypothetical protein
MMAFEEEYANAEYVTVFERVGSPECKTVEELDEIELEKCVKWLLKLLNNNDIKLEILDGPYDDKIIYRFITEELFTIKVESKPVAGMTCNFIYEEFHPNHNADIIKRSHSFLLNWFGRKFTEYCTELSWHCITVEGEQLTREDVVGKMNIFFDAFQHFQDDGYNINNVSFELQEENEKGMGFAEGMVKYDAVMDNGEIIHYEGPYKLYLQLEDNWWSIFYFVMPGFKW